MSSGNPLNIPDDEITLGDDNVTDAYKICVLTGVYGDRDTSTEWLGARISAIFVILVVSGLCTFFPVVARRVRWLHIPYWVYLFAKYFGAGVIIATSYIHLLDPAYGNIGPNTCVGMTGNWALYSWVPAIVMASAIAMFLLDFGSLRYVQAKYGVSHGHGDEEAAITGGGGGPTKTNFSEDHIHGPEDDCPAMSSNDQHESSIEKHEEDIDTKSELSAIEAKKSFSQQLSAALVLDFGVIFHSVVIGLNLGVASDEFSTLYPVLVFHQSFEGLGIGARFSVIPYPDKFAWIPYALCGAYTITTPLCVAIGLGVRQSFNPGSYDMNIISGFLNAISSGILMYTGWVEFIAHDFMFNPDLTQDNKRVGFMIICLLVGAGLMALIGKWA